MGRVTVFAIDDCPFCIKAKNKLKEKEVQYLEINLSDYPQRRTDMLQMAKLLTVPQIFINEQHIGGATELLEMVETGKFDEIWSLEKDKENSTDKRLREPEGPPTPKPNILPRNIENFKAVNANGEAQATEYNIFAIVKSIEKKYGAKKFMESEMNKFLLENFGDCRLEGNDKNVKLNCQTLFEFGILRKRENFNFYLEKAQKPTILNSYRVWDDRIDDKNPLLVVTDLKKRLGKIVSKHRNADGLVDYIAVGQDPDFAEFDEATCELQRISLSKMDKNTKIAFGINLYNTMIIHAFSKVGEAKSMFDRFYYFGDIGYEIGGLYYSMYDLENGVLRANRLAPYQFSPCIPFKDSKRIAQILRPEEVDCRIHFALNCGARSCPPVKKFSAEALDEELEIVSQSFFQQPENCIIDLDNFTLKTTQIVGWYREDFGGKRDADVARTLAQWLPEDKKIGLKQIVDSKKFKILYSNYDWTTDAESSITYKHGGMLGALACKLL